MTADLTAAELERMRRVAEGACDAADSWADFDNTFGPFAVRALLDRLEAAEARVARVEALAREWSMADDMDECGNQQAIDGHELREALELPNDCECRDCEYVRNPPEPMTAEEMAESAARSVQAFIELNRHTSAAMAKAMDQALRGDT